MEMIKVEQLYPAEGNRTKFDKVKFEELKQSIKEHGIITPLLVRSTSGSKGPTIAYEIVNGARRYEAARELKLKEVPAEIRTLSDEEAAQLRIIENLQREDIGPLEEAQEYERMSKQFGNTVDAIAEKVSKPKSYIKARLALLALPADILKAHKDDKITINHLIIIAKIADAKKQVKLFQEIQKYNLDPAASERIRGQVLNNYDLERAIFDKKACGSCEHNAGKQESIFGGKTEDSGCLNPDCFIAKTEARLQKEKAKFGKKGENVLTKIEAKEQKYAKLPQGYNGFSESQMKKCAKCANHAVTIEPGWNGIDQEIACKNRECVWQLKEAAKKRNENSNQGARDDWDLKKGLDKIVTPYVYLKTRERMNSRLLWALIVKKTIFSGGNIDTKKLLGFKGDNYNIPLHKLYELGEEKLKALYGKITYDMIDLRNDGLDEAAGILGINVKKEIVIDKKALKLAEIEPEKLPSFLAFAKKQGFKVEGEAEIKKTEPKKK